MSEVKFLGSYNGNGPGRSGAVFDKDYLSPTLNTMQGGATELHIIEQVGIKQATKEGVIPCNVGGVFDSSYPDSITRRGRVQDNGEICPTLTAESENICRVEKEELLNRYRIRKLTPLECWRLMGFSDSDFYKAESVNSNTQLYKQAGNSIVVNVLEEIFKKLNIDGVH